MSKEPAFIIGALVSAIVALASIFGVVVDADTLTLVLFSVAPIVTGLLVRFKVYAPANVVSTTSDTSSVTTSSTTTLS